jgi:hypothetical protein
MRYFIVHGIACSILIPTGGPGVDAIAMSFLKRLVRSPRFQKAAGVMAAEYLRLVFRTTRFVYEPEPMYAEAETLAPVIVGMWHGQHFLMPFLRRGKRAKVLVSRHRDGEINALAAHHRRRTVRGSGARPRFSAGRGWAYPARCSTPWTGYDGTDRGRPQVSRVPPASPSSRACRAPDLPGRHRHPKSHHAQLGPLGGQPAVQPRRMVGDGPVYVPPMRRAALEAAGRRSDRFNATTARPLIDGPRRGAARGAAHG